MTKVEKLERASRTAYRQFDNVIRTRVSHKRMSMVLTRMNKINRKLTAIKMADYDTKLAEQRTAAQSLLDAITRDLTDEQRHILRPYMRLSI